MQAPAVGRQALDLTVRLTSARSVRCLRDLVCALRPQADVPRPSAASRWRHASGCPPQQGMLHPGRQRAAQGKNAQLSRAPQAENRPERTLVRGSSVVAAPVRSRPCQADGSAHRSPVPIFVRYASVDGAIGRSTARQGDTRRDRDETPRSVTFRRPARLRASLTCSRASFAARAGSGAFASSSSVSEASRSPKASSAAGPGAY